VLLADEINRAGPRTQSALLEAMEEQQVTVEGETRALPRPFFVIATQNPSDQLGTYPLPESQLDRFLMCITLGYPDRASERELLAGQDRREAVQQLRPVMSPEGLMQAQQAVLAVHASNALLDYLQALIAATRSGAWFVEGLSPRAGIAVLRAAKAHALLDRRDHVAPDDIQAILVQTAAHRLIPVSGAGRGRAGQVRAMIEAVIDLAAARRPLRRHIDGWFQARSPRTDSLLLTQRNVYILPTRAGLMFCFTLGVLLIASINYQLNLGYLLTFLLAGSGLVSMHMTHNTLRGLTLHLRPVSPVFAGDTARLEAVLASPDGARCGIGLRLQDADAATLGYTDVPAGGQALLHLGFVPAQRGLHALPTLNAETRFPLGLFRAWAVWRPAMSLLVYPQPERPVSALPPARAVSGGTARARTSSSGEFEGIRGYRRGDPLKTVAWRSSAKAMASGGELVSRDSSTQSRQQLWLDWQSCGVGGAEARLSRLAAWILEADRRDMAWGLSLPGREIPIGHGDAHRRQGLEALALWTP
jgi:uncharacterized protein (DUF58 family)